MIIYSIYKKNHPVTPKQVFNVFDLGYRCRGDFPEHPSALPYKKENKQRVITRRKKV